MKTWRFLMGLIGPMGRIGLISLIGPICPLSPTLFAQAQTNADEAVAPATNAPADLASTPTPVPAPEAAPAPASVPAAPPPFNMSNGPGQTTAQGDHLYDIRPPFFFLHSRPWLWIALAVASVALALLLALWLWLRPHRLLSPKSAYELALEKLEKARALLREEDPMPYAVLVSEAIRSYLGQCFLTPSTRRTTEEFLRQMEADQNTPLAEHRELLKNFLQSCDLVKFARYQPTLTELEGVHERATTFVTATKPVPAPGHRNGSRP